MLKEETMIGRQRIQFQFIILIGVCLIFSGDKMKCAIAAPTEADDVEIITPWQLELLIEEFNNLNPEYQLHLPPNTYRNRLRSFLQDRQQPPPYEQQLQQQIFDDYDYPDEDKRSVASLASHGGYFLTRPGPKRSLATLAKNGQLPTLEPDYADAISSDREQEVRQWGGNADDDVEVDGGAKRNIGSLARSGGYLNSGKRNIGTLARDFQLPQSGKRNVATMARLGLLSSSSNRDLKRHIASLARLNSFRSDGGGEIAAKRNIGALKGSPVHGISQKKNSDQIVMSPDDAAAPVASYNEAYFPNNLLYYPSYGDFLDSLREEKRFLDFKSFEDRFPSIDRGEYVTSADDDEDAIHEHKRHIGSLARSGLLPAAFRPFRSGRFSRSGRARQIVEYYPQPERLRLPIAAVCRQCFLPPNKQAINWRMSTSDLIGSRSGKTRYFKDKITTNSLQSNSLPIGEEKNGKIFKTQKSWGTPPRITALHRSSFRQGHNYSY